MVTAYINRIATAVPRHDVHQTFLDFAHSRLATDGRNELLFARMAEKSGIEHRYSDFAPAPANSRSVDGDGFYRFSDFPDTGARMKIGRAHV